MTQAAVAPFPPCCHGWLLALGLPLADLHAGCPMMEVCPEATIHRLRAPVLFLHSRRRPLIPCEHSQRLYERAAEPKRLCIFELENHGEGFGAQRELYHEQVLWLLEKGTQADRRNCTNRLNRKLW